MSTLSKKEQLLIEQLEQIDQVRELVCRRNLLRRIFGWTGFLTVIIIAGMIWYFQRWPDVYFIMIVGLILAVWIMKIELLDHRILAAKLLRQLSREAVTEVIHELRQLDNVHNE